MRDDDDDDEDVRAVDAGCGDARGDENIISIGVSSSSSSSDYVDDERNLGGERTTRDDDGGAIHGGVDVYRCV